MQLVHKKGFINLIYSLFIFEMLFPSFRVLLIGHEGANTFIEYFIASLPEFFLAIIACYTFALLFKENIQMKWVITDKLVLFFILFNVIIGTYLAANLKISLYGFRMSYLPVFFYFLVRFSPIKKDDFLQLINKLFTLFSFVGLLGIIIYFFFFDFMVDMIHKTGSGVTEYFIPRMTSILWTPVVFGTFMSITFCYFYFKLFQKNASKLNYFLLSIASFCTFFSLSRGSIIIM